MSWERERGPIRKCTFDWETVHVVFLLGWGVTTVERESREIVAVSYGLVKTDRKL